MNDPAIEKKIKRKVQGTLSRSIFFVFSRPEWLMWMGVNKENAAVASLFSYMMWAKEMKLRFNNFYFFASHHVGEVTRDTASSLRSYSFSPFSSPTVKLLVHP